MSNESRNSTKRKLNEIEDFELNKKMDKSVHLLHICDEFGGKL